MLLPLCFQCCDDADPNNASDLPCEGVGGRSHWSHCEAPCDNGYLTWMMMSSSKCMCTSRVHALSSQLRLDLITADVSEPYACLFVISVFGIMLAFMIVLLRSGGGVRKLVNPTTTSFQGRL